ncbi:MAG TPA: hypothetical protein ENH01_11165 [Nitrospirae bacterium]|nr:hypothetical protein [Nitrospirota bacterium]
MINQLSAISGQEPAEGTDKKHAEFEKVAKEMESLFAYQLLKIMRETSNSMSTDKKGNGYNTYMSLFDMEVSRLLADRGLGLQDTIMKWLERMPDANNYNGSNNNNAVNNKQD